MQTGLRVGLQGRRADVWCNFCFFRTGRHGSVCSGSLEPTRIQTTTSHGAAMTPSHDHRPTNNFGESPKFGPTRPGPTPHAHKPPKPLDELTASLKRHINLSSGFSGLFGLFGDQIRRVSDRSRPCVCVICRFSEAINLSSDFSGLFGLLR